MKEGIVESDTIMEEFCTKYKFIRWYETSARENMNIVPPILFLIKEVRKKHRSFDSKHFVFLYF